MTSGMKNSSVTFCPGASALGMTPSKLSLVRYSSTSSRLASLAFSIVSSTAVVLSWSAPAFPSERAGSAPAAAVGAPWPAVTSNSYSGLVSRMPAASM